MKNWTIHPDATIARVSLKLLFDEDVDEPQHVIDQARAWLKENFCRSAVKETAE